MLDKKIDSNTRNNEFTLGIIGLSIAIFMSNLDIAVINLALPHISNELNISFVVSIWAITSYQLVMAALILPLAVLADKLSYRRIFQIGLIIFTTASFFCGSAQTIEQLIWARALQGLGAAAILATNIALIRQLYPSEKLGLGLGINAFLLALGFVTGPVIASIVLSHFHWSWIFLLNIPMGIVSYFLCHRIPKDKVHKLRNINILSTLLSMVMFSSIIFALASFSISNSLKNTGIFLSIGIISGILLYLRDKNHKYPIFPIDLFKNSIFSFSLITAFFGFVTQGVALVALPYIFFSLNYSKQEIPLFILAWPLMGAITGPVAGMLSNRISPAYLGGAGLLLIAVGLGNIAYFTDELPQYIIFIIMLFCGIGFGLFFAPNQRMLMSNLAMSRSGIAGGMLNISRIIGQTVGTSVVAISIHFSSNSLVAILVLGALAAFCGSLASLYRLKYSD
ncbi:MULTISPECIES: MFS transporter [unclassified Acinetobacter]|uniref:MFS transporter n=1 Tax=unclassified Acinetobacter TaxID=196816 RepID=UPI001C249162|nr:MULTISPECIES: MFS transporter [unclassified Acinetobacter]